MADNVIYTLDANSTPPAGTPVASDEIGGVQYQRVKLTLGADGAADNDVDSGQQVMAASVPVAIASDQGAVPVSAASLPLPGGAATAARQDIIALLVDGLEALLATVAGAVAGSEMQVDVLTLPAVTGTVTANAGTNLNTSALALEAGGNLAAAATALAILDDWDETDRAKVNPIAGQAGVQGGSGAVTALTQRVALATDVGLPAGANALGSIIAAGDVAHDAADSGNPVKMGGKGYAPDTGPTDVAANDRTNLFTDLKGRIVTYLATALDETNDKIRAVTEGYKATYSAGFAALAPAITATDILEIIGSATKTVRILRIQISGVATAAGAYNVQLIKRSTAATGGTSTSATIVPHDSANAAGTAVVKGYTANPTVGIIVGIARSQRVTVSTGAGAIPIVPVVFDFTTRNGQGIVLRGIAQTLCLNLAGVTMTGGLLDIDVELSEE